MATMYSVRNKVREMADMRALEEQAERANPLRGMGATPSMGLSTVRGGRSLAKRIARKEAESPSLYIEEADEEAEMPSGEYGRMSAAGRQGAQLGRHIHSLHGAGFFDDFAKGFMSVIKPVASIASMMPGPIGTAARVASGFLGSGGMDMDAYSKAVKALPTRAEVEEKYRRKRGGMNTGKYEGEGHPPDIDALYKTVARNRDVVGTHPDGKPKLVYRLMYKGFLQQYPDKPPTKKKLREDIEKIDAHREKHPEVKGKGKLVITHGDDSDSGSESGMEGGGFISDLGIPIVSNLAGMFGLGDEKARGGRKARRTKAQMKEAEIGEVDAFLKKNPKFAEGYKDKRPVGAEDGRRKRAQIVKRIMNERGLSMIEASRVVKNEKLY